ncbi:MAG TPA: UDP-N-acetylmuramate dehydrogenase [Streptosporangiaceae bacterium]|nr:UDP-N-acetylmuramate dehydrogenase [Streptosporangiaceae bacterium]
MPVHRTEQVSLAGYTTLRLGGPAARFIEVSEADQVIDSVREADRAGEPLLVLGGGSNLVIADAGFPGTVIRVTAGGVSVTDADEQVLVTVAAGEPWDRLVDWAVAEKLAGIECLAGIPGLAGATPIQNVGAYGQEVASTVSTVTVFDRAAGALTTLTGVQCGFGYRTSIFKTAGWPPAPVRHGEAAGPTGRFIVIDVTFSLRRDPMSAPVRYAELAARLGISVGEQAPLADVRQTVLELRRGKGMLLDAADPDTFSAGSFFTNPVLGQAQLADVEARAAARTPGVKVPRFAADGGSVKVPAGWLIEHAGFGKGYQGPGGARISSKHTLALTNNDGATTADLLGLAREVAAGVRQAFGVVLTNEPTLVGVRL